MLQSFISRIINYLSSIVKKDIELRTGGPEPHIVRCRPFFVYVIYWRLQRFFIRETSTSTISVILNPLSRSFLCGFKILTAKTWRTFYGNKSLCLFCLLLPCCFFNRNVWNEQGVPVITPSWSCPEFLEYHLAKCCKRRLCTTIDTAFLMRIYIDSGLTIFIIPTPATEISIH